MLCAVRKTVILKIFTSVLTHFVWGKNIEFQIFNFLNETFSIDLSLILKNNQPELDEHGHDFMPNMPIFQKKIFSKMSPKYRKF